MNEPTPGDRIVIVLTTVPDAAAGATLARALVDARLAACVSRVPGIASVYRFEGAVHEDAEELLLIKTTRRRIAELEARLGGLHPYQVPEFVVIDAASVGARYGDWLRSVVG
jgi:periplasmic divalent cation tolerance protein